MSGVKYTPGPWECDGDFFEVCRVEFEGSGSYTTISSRSRISSPVAFAVGTPDTNWRDDTEQEANARLIAAAPDLLEAAQNAVEEWGMRAGDDDALLPLAEQPESIAALMRALARARGEQDGGGHV